MNYFSLINIPSLTLYYSIFNLIYIYIFDCHFVRSRNYFCMLETDIIVGVVVVYSSHNSGSSSSSDRVISISSGSSSCSSSGWCY